MDKNCNLSISRIQRDPIISAKVRADQMKACLEAARAKLAVHQSEIEKSTVGEIAQAREGLRFHARKFKSYFKQVEEYEKQLVTLNSIAEEEELENLPFLVYQTSLAPNIVAWRGGKKLANTVSLEFQSQLLRKRDISIPGLRAAYQQNKEIFHIIRSNKIESPQQVLFIGYLNKAGSEEMVCRLHSNAKTLAKELFGENIKFVKLNAAYSVDYRFFRRQLAFSDDLSDRSGYTVTLPNDIKLMQNHLNGFAGAKLNEIQSVADLFAYRVLDKFSLPVLKELRTEYKLPITIIGKILEQNLNIALYEGSDAKAILYRALSSSQKGFLFLTKNLYGQVSSRIICGLETEVSYRHKYEYKASGGQDPGFVLMQNSPVSEDLDSKSEQSANENQTFDDQSLENVIHEDNKYRNFSEGLDLVGEMVVQTIEIDILDLAIEHTAEGSVFNANTTLETETQNLCTEIAKVAIGQKNRLTFAFEGRARIQGDCADFYNFSLEGDPQNNNNTSRAAEQISIYKLIKNRVIYLSDCTQLMAYATKIKQNLHGVSRERLELARNDTATHFMSFINKNGVYFSIKHV